jgi:hypothetical protein
MSSVSESESESDDGGSSSSSSSSSSRSTGSSTSIGSENTNHGDDDNIVIEPDCYIYSADTATTRNGRRDEDDDDTDDDAADDTDTQLEMLDEGGEEMTNASDTPARVAAVDMDKWLYDQLQASIFYEEPVHHITFHTMFVGDGGDLERIESRVVELTEPNVVGRFVIGNIVKRARLTAGGVVGYRLNSLFIYNAHVSLMQLAKYVRNPHAFSFVTALSSLNDIIIKPTLACFHSLNSVHIVLRRLPQTQRTTTTTTQPTTTQPTTTTRVVSITRSALSSSVRRFTRRRETDTLS